MRYVVFLEIIFNIGLFSTSTDPPNFLEAPGACHNWVIIHSFLNFIKAMAKKLSFKKIYFDSARVLKLLKDSWSL